MDTSKPMVLRADLLHLLIGPNHISTARAFPIKDHSPTLFMMFKINPLPIVHRLSPILFARSPIVPRTNHERDHDLLIADHEFVMLRCGMSLSPDPACLGCCNRCSPVLIMPLVYHTQSPIASTIFNEINPVTPYPPLILLLCPSYGLIGTYPSRVSLWLYLVPTLPESVPCLFYE